MALLIGVDEAGYSPNLGPLVVAATAFETSDSGLRIANGKKRSEAIPDLYKLLRQGISRAPDGQRVAIADSKVLYRPGAGLANLERGVLAAIHAVRWLREREELEEPPPLALPPRTGEEERMSWVTLVQTLAADVERRQSELPWHAEFDCKVPCACDRDDVVAASERLASAMQAKNVRLLGIRARLVFPREFNELCAQFGNKAAALSEVTLRLVREIVRKEQETRLTASTFILCDKHGGRNRYAALVQQHFPESWVETRHESRAESWYRTAGEMPLDFCFRMKGESFLPAALASMTAKYMRELSMRAFNEYWCGRVKELRPTAGYPTDAKRYRIDIAHEQRRLGIADKLLWREK